jgi:hypothetical protein
MPDESITKELELKIERMRQRTASLEVAAALMRMSWFQKLFNEMMDQETPKKDAKPKDGNE